MIRHLVTAALTAFLVGCAAHPISEPPIRKEAFIHLKIVDEMPQGEDVAGYTECSEHGICRIWIRSDHYPLCIEHEVGHVTHGPWHGNLPTECYRINPPLF